MSRTSPTRAATVMSARRSISPSSVKRVGVDDREVLGVDGVGGHRGARGGDDGRRIARAVGHGVARGAKRGVQREGPLAVVGPQPDVAARERQAVGLAHGLDRLDAHGDVEVAHHPPDDGELLAVLLPEVRDVRRGHVQQLQHDGRDALEVDRSAVVALEPGAGPATVTVVAKPARVDLLRRGREHDVHARRLGDRRVGGLVRG